MRTDRKLGVRPLVALVALMMVVAACSSDTDADNPDPTNPGTENATTLESAREAGIIKLGFVAARPVSYVDEDTGEATGSGLVVADEILGRSTP